MRVPNGEQIAGLSPAVVKRLVRQEQFDSPSAMRVLKLGEPRASEILTELCLQGWIDFAGTENFIDWWRCGPLGERLSATRILRRISYERGRAILQRAIARAREINAEPDHSRRITKIVLFGSLLDATNRSIGDIDIAIQCTKRRLSAAELKAIEKKEQMSMTWTRSRKLSKPAKK
jgi:predicted nucleotidyltransferase